MPARPATLPKASRTLVAQKALKRWRADGNEGPLPVVYVLAVRAYRKRTMGDPGRNDVGIFDDAFFLVTPDGMLAENANTDPSRLGWNPGVGKPYGILQPGVWWFYPGPHKGLKGCFRQADDAAVAKKLGIPHEGKFKVMRMWGWDDPRNYLEWGHQQVNIHPATVSSTSSWLCLTLPWDRAKAWLAAATGALKKHRQKLLPVILIEGPIS
jgi:lysozyme